MILPCTHLVVDYVTRVCYKSVFSRIAHGPGENWIPVPRGRSIASAPNPKFARMCRELDRELRVQRGTRIIELLVVLDSEVRKRGVPHDDANFGIGPLVREPPNESPGRCVQRPGPLVPAIDQKLPWQVGDRRTLVGGKWGRAPDRKVVH